MSELRGLRNISSDKLSHAYLLVGQGLCRLAKEFTLAINCRERCGQCATCHKIIRGVHPDVRWIAKTGQRIGIDQIRELKEDALYPPVESAKKIYILDGVEDMSIEAANSLLRILEGPPPYLIFLLLARGLGEIPLTIVSRCQIIFLRSASRAQIKRELSSLAEEEINYLLALTKGMDYLLARLKLRADYRPLAEKEKVIEKLKELNDQELIEFFAEEDGLIGEREAILELLKKLPRLSVFALLEAAAALSKLERTKLEMFFYEALCWFRDMLIIKIKYNEMPVMNLDQVDELQKYSLAFSLEELEGLIKEFNLAERELRGNANVQLLLESLLLRMRCPG